MWWCILVDSFFSTVSDLKDIEDDGDEKNDVSQNIFGTAYDDNKEVTTDTNEELKQMEPDDNELKQDEEKEDVEEKSDTKDVDEEKKDSGSDFAVEEDCAEKKDSATDNTDASS